MIIVGNREALKRIDVWKDFVKFCDKNKLNVKGPNVFEGSSDEIYSDTEIEGEFDEHFDDYEPSNAASTVSSYRQQKSYTSCATYQRAYSNKSGYYYDVPYYDSSKYYNDCHESMHPPVFSNSSKDEKKSSSMFTMKNCVLLSLVATLYLRKNEGFNLKNLFIFSSGLYIFNDFHKPVLSIKNALSLLMLYHTFKEN